MRGMLVLGLLLGCKATSGSDSAFTVNGVVTGVDMEQSARVAVLWWVHTPTPEHQYKYGDGTASQDGFVLKLADVPPAGAINDTGLAIGDLVMFDDTMQIADGPYTADSATFTGVATDYGLIWKDAMATGLGTWDTKLGAGYSCGKCNRSTSGGLDGYDLVACAQVTIEVGGQADCAWF